MSMAESVNISVPREVAERLDRLAEGSAQTRASLAALAIETWLADEERNRESIVAGMREIQAGKSIPHEEVRRWLDSWGSDNELPPPTCE
mgnify:CR=1 FL=1